MAVLCIIQDSHFVVVEVYFIDEHINQGLAVFRVVYMQAANKAIRVALVSITYYRFVNFI